MSAISIGNETVKRHVLVVDDERDMVETLVDLLEMSGCQVSVAYDGNEAVERVREQVPDCILMDLRMPNSSGVEAFREIRKLCPDAYVIFMTGFSHSDLVQQAIREGAVEVLSKPIDIAQTLELIKKAPPRTGALIVDDDPDFCLALKDTLLANSFRVKIAHDLTTAFQLYEVEPSSVVILNAKLQNEDELDGVAIFRKLNPLSIVIILGELAEHEGSPYEGIVTARYATFAKPFDVAELVRTIRETVNGKAPH